jgi:hypothetical protein
MPLLEARDSLSTQKCTVYMSATKAEKMKWCTLEDFVFPEILSARHISGPNPMTSSP